MPTNIKLIITLLVALITGFVSYNHFILNECARSVIILVVGVVMVFGLWILPEATGKTKEKNEKK